MSLLRLAVLGPPEVFRDGSRLTFPLRKAQALLLYLAVEGGMHPRSKLVGDEHQAREAVRRLEERLVSNQRFRIPYLRSLAILAAWEGARERAIGHLREAAQLAAEIGLPAEQWQIQAALGSVYEVGGESAQARKAFREAARIIQGLAEGIKDKTLRSRFLAGPQIHPVLQHAQRLATSLPDDHTEPSGL